ncbi:MAG: class I SAM-dependent methyltransferase [Alphaproteobacteria bacterium]|nr:MAG: class I SAM-dependent methyltransferase [Alphaproteobacteria bacterium]
MVDIMLEKKNKCVCNSTEFKEYHKHSQTLDLFVEYVQCKSCGMITAPESKNYNLSKIYTDEYFTKVDHGWKGRAKIVCIYIKYINTLVPLKKMQICDFGAGNGYLSKALIDKEFNVLAYEPFTQKNTYLEKSYYCDAPFNADVLLMVEVFEHFTNAFEEIRKILADFHDPKLIIFTTNLTDNASKPIDDWFYLEPDSGHFTLWSKKSLTLLGEMNGYKLISLDDTFLHIFCKASDMKMCNNLKILSIPVRFAMKIRGFVKEFFK